MKHTAHELEQLATDWLWDAAERHGCNVQLRRLSNSIERALGDEATLDDLVAKYPTELLDVRGFGNGQLQALQVLLQSDGLSLGMVEETSEADQEIELRDALAVTRQALESLTAERDLFKARHAAIYRALQAKEFDQGGKPLDRLERELKIMQMRVSATTQILWNIARAAGGTYSFNARHDPSGLGGCPSALGEGWHIGFGDKPGVYGVLNGDGVMTITAVA